MNGQVNIEKLPLQTDLPSYGCRVRSSQINQYVFKSHIILYTQHNIPVLWRSLKTFCQNYLKIISASNTYSIFSSFHFNLKLEHEKNVWSRQIFTAGQRQCRSCRHIPVPLLLALNSVQISSGLEPQRYTQLAHIQDEISFVETILLKNFLGWG